MKKYPIFLAVLFLLFGLSESASASLITFADLQPGQSRDGYDLDVIIVAAGLFGLNHPISRHHVDPGALDPLLNAHERKKWDFLYQDRTLIHYCDYDRRGDYLSHVETGFVDGLENNDFMTTGPQDRPHHDNGHDHGKTDGAAPVPEPATLLLLSAGLLAGALTLRRNGAI